MSRILVIDTSIIRGAGKNGGHSLKKCLDSIRSICHCIAVSAELEMEYCKHIKPYHATYNLGGEWYTSMRRLGKVKQVREANYNKAKQDIISNFENPDELPKVILKDLHLIATAYLSEKRVISSDIQFVRDIRNQKRIPDHFDSIFWVYLEPSGGNEEEVLNWLKDNAKEVDEYLFLKRST